MLEVSVPRNRSRRLPIDAYVVAFSEVDHYQIREEDRPHIQDIRGVYLFDRHERTFCCEMTPSYWLIHLYDEVVLTPEAQEALDELEKDTIYQEYEYCGGDDIYVHCHTIDGMIEADKPNTVYHYGWTAVRYRDSDHEEQMEGLREHFCCNHCL
jgi:hypothetical protein